MIHIIISFTRNISLAVVCLTLSSSCASRNRIDETSETQAARIDRKNAFYSLLANLEESPLKMGMSQVLEKNYATIQSQIDLAANQISDLGQKSTEEKIQLVTDMYSHFLSFFVNLELPLYSKIYQIEANQVAPAVKKRNAEMSRALGQILNAAAKGKLDFLIDYNKIPGLKTLSQWTRLTWPPERKDSSLNLTTPSAASASLAVFNGASLDFNALPQIAASGIAASDAEVNVKAETENFRAAFQKIVPNSLIISSMLIGIAAAVIVTVATLNPAIGGGVGVATGFAILAFVGGSYGIVQTIESYKTQVHGKPDSSRD
ncbi:MAG: hypothetical protein WCI18_13435 [Pseudomonadota bacterium]